MEDLVWIQMNPHHQEQPRRDALPVDQHRLLLMRATSSNDYPLLESMLFSLRSTETPVIHSAMCRAASRGNLRIFKLLSLYCEDIHADDSRRATNTVISAVVGGHHETLDYILANGGDIDRSTSSGRTALATVLSLGRWNLLRLVLSRGADVSKLLADGRTYLCMAATMGRADCVEMLLRHGASVNCGCHCFTPGMFDRFHCAMDFAALRGHEDVVTLLLNHGACFFRESDLFMTSLEAVLNRGQDDLARRLVATGPSVDSALHTRNITPLCLAVQRGSLTTARFLVACGASIHVPSRDGPPLSYAALSNNSTIADWLLRSGADANAACSETYGRAIHIAVEFGFVGMVDILLRNGAVVYADSPKGYPLQIARQERKQSCTSERQRRYEAIIELLRNAGASDEESRAASAGIHDTHTEVVSPAPDAVTDRFNSWKDWG